MSPTSGIGFAERLGGDGERVHVGGLALIGRHAGRGVALDVLDRAQALAHRELDVLGADVVLEIDEGLGVPARRALERRAERRRTRRRVVDCIGSRAPARQIRPPRGLAPAARPRRAPRQDRTRRCRRRRSARAWADRRAENLPRLVEGELAARLREADATDGVQPPDISSASQAIRPQPPAMRLRAARALDRAACPRVRPRA